MGVIFVAGIHVVGKSTACEKTSHTKSIPYFSVGALIKAEEEVAISKRGKAVADIKGNQGLLTQAVDKTLNNVTGNILLDGHLTLINPNKEISKLDISVFQSLHLKHLVVFRDDPTEILKRITKRDQDTYSLDFITLHQDKELEHVEFIAKNLQIPLTILNAFDDKGLVQDINAL